MASGERLGRSDDFIGGLLKLRARTAVAARARLVAHPQAIGMPE